MNHDQIANIHWIMEKAREFQKNIYFCFTDYSKALCGSQQTGKFFKEYQTTWHASWEICMQVKNQQLELDMEQQTGSKLEKVSFHSNPKERQCQMFEVPHNCTHLTC